MRKVSCVVLVLAVSACAPPFMWVKEGATQSDFNRDMARCKYEAASATANYNTGRTAGTLSGAIARGIGEGMAIGSRQVELIQLCLQAQGYTKHLIQTASPTPYEQSATPVAVVQPVQPIAQLQLRPLAVKAPEGVPTQDAETAKVVQVLNDTGFPVIGDPVRFKQKGKLTFYEARGTGGKITQVACDSGICRLRTIYD